MIDKLAHLPVALTNQAHDGDLRRIMLGKTPKQNALADAASAEYAYPLAFPDWKQPIDHAHSGHQALGDVPALQWVGRWSMKWVVSK